MKEIDLESIGIGKSCILAGYRGSLAHNTYIPPEEKDGTDDIDVMAIVVPPVDYYFGLLEYGSRGTVEKWVGNWDIVLYEARKFVRLLGQGNPNVLNLLWLEDDLYLKRTNAGDHLLANRNLFVGKHVYDSFCGYARGQAHRMEHGVFDGYCGSKRRERFESLGYDAKNASCLIRLLRQGIEFLQTGELLVRRPDADELIAIKRGEWPLEKVKAEADRLFELALDIYVKSKLPERSDAKTVNSLCCEVVAMALEERGLSPLPYRLYVG